MRTNHFRIAVLAGALLLGCSDDREVTAPTTRDGIPPAATMAGTLVFEETFSSYANDAAWRTSSKWVEWLNPNRQHIDTGVFYGTSNRSVRFDFQADTDVSDPCKQPSIGAVTKPSGVVGLREAWLEYVVRFEPGWHTDNLTTNCPYAPDHKLVRVYTSSSGSYNYFGIKDGSGSQERWAFGFPGNAANGDKRATRTSNQDWDGEWHVIRQHIRASTDDATANGLVRATVDGNALTPNDGSSTVNVITPGARTVHRVSVGMNLNMYPDSAQSMWVGRVRIYSTDPGWGI